MSDEENICQRFEQLKTLRVCAKSNETLESSKDRYINFLLEKLSKLNPDEPKALVRKNLFKNTEGGRL